MDPIELGQRLREARRQAGLTQSQAAARLGVTYQAVSNYERGKCRVEPGTLKRLAILYRVSPVALLSGARWSESCRALYREAVTAADRLALFEQWGVPADMAAEYEALRALQEAAPQAGLSREEEALLTLFRSIPPADQTLVLDMVEAALKSQGLLPPAGAEV